jgi:fatty-acyl-CoA synthase
MRIHDIVSLYEQKAPDAPAVIFDDRSTSYAQLGRRVRALAGGLGSRVAPGARVGILSKNRPEFV